MLKESPNGAKLLRSLRAKSGMSVMHVLYLQFTFSNFFKFLLYF